MRPILTAIILSLLSTTVIADNEAKISCKGTDPAVNIEIQETIRDGVNQNYDHLSLKINHNSYEFKDKEISRYNDSPFNAKVIMPGIILVYYIPLDEYQKGVPPYNGRILFIRPRYIDSRAMDALCLVN